METVKCPNCRADNNTGSKYCGQCGQGLRNLRPVIPGHQSSDIAGNGKKKLIGLATGVAAFAVAYWGVQQFLFSPPSFDKMMMQVAGNLNETCPVMVDNETRFDNAIALPPNTFQYNYTLVNVSRTQVNIDTVKKYIEPEIVNSVKTNPDLKIFRDHETTIVYCYKDKDGKFVHKIVVTPDLYQ